MRWSFDSSGTLSVAAGLARLTDGHRLEFRRTFHHHESDGLRGVLRIRRGASWEKPKLDAEQGEGFLWRKIREDE